MLEQEFDDRILVGTVAALIVILGGLLLGLVALVLGVPVLDVLGRAASSLFGFDSANPFWYVTRSAGIIAYLLLWFSTAWGVAISSRIIDPLLHRSFTFDLHQFTSLLSLGFTALHILALLGDRFVPFNVAQILIPFIHPYRTIWVGLGILGLYVSVLVTVTFYIRRRISYRTFHLIHFASYVGYVGVTLHGLFAGTDSNLPATILMYAGSALVVVFLTVYRILYRPSADQPAVNHPGTARRVRLG